MSSSYSVPHESTGALEEDIESLRERQSISDQTRTWADTLSAYFPNFGYKRIAVILVAVEIIVYVAAVIVSWTGNLSPTEGILMKFGATYGPWIRRGEVWRLITPIFLHASPLHLLINIVVILHLGLIAERRLGVGNAIFIIAASGIIGNCASVLTSPCTISVGASTSGFGLIGSFIGELSLAWESMSDAAKKSHSINMMIFCITMLFINMLPTVDTMGHVGGLIAGFAIVFWCYRNTRGNPSWVPKAMYGFGTIAVLFPVLMILRLLMVPPTCIYG